MKDDGKISLSMKLVDQGSGRDLDPNGVQMLWVIIHILFIFWKERIFEINLFVILYLVKMNKEEKLNLILRVKEQLS